jgi:hypothetical protein
MEIRARTLLIAAAIMMLCPATRSLAQTEPLVDATRKLEPDPVEICRGLLSDSIDERIAALTAVGVAENLRQNPPGPSYEDLTAVRDVTLIHVRLDDNPDPEVVLTFGQGTYAQGAVFRREGAQWFRVALLNCWCKYERDPLARFLEVRQLVDPRHDDLIVRDSLGGTGVYWRDAVFYRMDNGGLREILRVPEERRNCNTQKPNQRATYCDVTLSRIFYPNWSPQQQAIVVTTVKGRENIPAPRGDFYPSLAGNLINSVPTGCEAFLWNEIGFRFGADATATATYCKPAPK